MASKKDSQNKIIKISRGPLKLKPTKVHKNKKAYSRRKSKSEIKSQI